MNERATLFKRYGALAVFTVLMCAVYLWWNASVTGAGFPLDDSWIHQTFARNLADSGRWEYVRGEPAAGSTSPLWTILLAAGYLFHIDHFVWTFFLGIVGLVLTAYICDLLWRSYQPVPRRTALPLFGLLIASEWHIVWGAVSGMETILYILMGSLILFLLLKAEPPWVVLGGLAGLLVWVRPDGLTLLGPVLFLALWNRTQWQHKLKSVGLILAGSAFMIGLYMAFNYQLDGSIWPNTLYAKQTEYAILREQPLLVRYFRLFEQINVGGGVILLPGFLWRLYRAIKNRDRWGLAAFLWVAGFVGIYAVQLPVTYQHARYLIPVIPVYLLLGFSGFLDLLTILSKSKRTAYIMKTVWLISLVGVQTAFFVLGARTYATDVAIINTEMVQTALWVAQNLPEEEYIGTHDIGALGYFVQNPLIDLAGLVNPEVISFIRDERQLQQYLRERSVKYLVTFPGWYPDIVKESEMIYNTNSLFSPQAGGENISVFLLQ